MTITSQLYHVLVSLTYVDGTVDSHFKDYFVTDYAIAEDDAEAFRSDVVDIVGVVDWHFDITASEGGDERRIMAWAMDDNQPREEHRIDGFRDNFDVARYMHAKLRRT